MLPLRRLPPPQAPGEHEPRRQHYLICTEEHMSALARGASQQARTTTPLRHHWFATRHPLDAAHAIQDKAVVKAVSKSCHNRGLWVQRQTGRCCQEGRTTTWKGWRRLIGPPAVSGAAAAQQPAETQLSEAGPAWECLLAAASQLPSEAQRSAPWPEAAPTPASLRGTGAAAAAAEHSGIP